MVCVINPDGTITCSDGDDADAAKVVDTVSQHGNGKAWDKTTINVANQAAVVQNELNASTSPKAVIIVDAK